MTRMRIKQRAETRRAQLTESGVLLAAVAWCTWLASSLFRESEADATAMDTHDTLLHVLPRVLHVLNAVAIAAVGRALFATHTVSKTMDELSRHERDSGLVVGCILPPLVLFSRFLAVAYSDSISISVPTFLYMWIATTASASLLIKAVCFGSSGVLPTLVVDVVLLPTLFCALGVECDLRFVIPTIGRVLIAFVLRFGRMALRRSFTVGEALLVAQTVGLGALDLVLSTILKLSEDETSSWLPDRFVVAWHLHASPLLEREPHQLALQVGVVGALMLCIALTPVLRSYGAPSPHVVTSPLPLGATLQFLGSVAIVAGALIYPWSCALLETSNPVAWLLAFVLERAVRWYLILYWFACLVVCVPAFAVLSQTLALRQIVARKLFHALVVVMFVPAFFVSPEMLSLSYGVAFAVFCLAECVRATSLPPFGQAIAAFVQPFIDHRESGRVILTHTYLLLGCALPLWLSHSTAPTSALAANAGVVALGVGDAMGAVIGSTFGKRKLFGRKTIEGTAAVLVSITLASFALHWHALQSGDFTLLALLLVGATLTSLLEAATAQIDNLVLSLFLFTVANLITCHA